MERERVRRSYNVRRGRGQAKEGIRFNKAIFAAVIIAAVLLFIKYLPPNSISNAISSVTGTSTDFAAMFREIKEVVIKHTLPKTPPPTDAANMLGTFATPVVGQITSNFGERVDPITGESKTHTGIDIAVPLNTSVLSAEAGEVIRAEENEYYGKFMMISHEGGLVSLYGHLSEILKETGDKVTKGQEIALSGNSGNSTGPHLHFEIRTDNIPIDPAPYFAGE